MIPVGFGGASGGYSITNSVRFNGTSTYFNRTPSTNGDGAKWTLSWWAKEVAATGCVFEARADANNRVLVGQRSGSAAGDICVSVRVSGSYYGFFSTPVYRDYSAHGHCVIIFDSSLATDTDRLQFWFNGVRQTVTVDTAWPSLNLATCVNQTTAVHQIAKSTALSNYWGGYLSDFYLIDGQALAPTSFGKTDANGVWVPIRYAGTYGTNGCKLEFKNSAALGGDTSGNGNNWTASGFSASDQMVDTPTNNYCTINPLDWGTSNDGTVKNGNLTLTGGASTANKYRGTIGHATMKFYFRCKVDTVTSGNPFVGIKNSEGAWGSASIGYNDVMGYSVSCSGALGQGTGAWGTAPFTYASGDYIDWAVDPVSGKCWVGKNGTWSGNPDAGTGALFTGLTGTWFPAISSYSTSSGTMDFVTPAPANSTSFKTLCTANLPAVSIKQPSQHFNTVLAAGASIKSSSEALYSNFFEWIKDRANSNNHQLIDTVRGTSAVLHSNDTGADTTYSAPSGASVGWVWNATAAAVTNTAGSINSQVSANPTAGVAVVKASIPPSGVVTFGHGLGATPVMVIGKPSSAAGAGQPWMVWHKSLSSAGQALVLNSTAAASAQTWLNNTAPTSSLITVNGAWAGVAFDEIFYVFAEVPGYSKFGSYIGNANADGAFAYCGFRPRWIMIKDTGAENWYILDTVRDAKNIAGAELLPNTSNPESVGNILDIVSNGFKLRNSGSAMNFNTTYIFAAFAEHPFGGSNVAPSPAR